MIYIVENLSSFDSDIIKYFGNKDNQHSTIAMLSDEMLKHKDCINMLKFYRLFALNINSDIFIINIDEYKKNYLPTPIPIGVSKQFITEHILKSIFERIMEINPEYTFDMIIAPELRNEFHNIWDDEKCPELSKFLDKSEAVAEGDERYQTILYTQSFKSMIDNYSERDGNVRSFLHMIDNVTIDSFMKKIKS